MGRYLAAFIACGLSLGGTASVAEEATPRPGRYQIVFSPLALADTFLIDTATGTVWQSGRIGDSDVYVWVLMQRIDRVLPPKAAAPSPKPPPGR
jgi:hypothetical protein